MEKERGGPRGLSFAERKYVVEKDRVLQNAGTILAEAGACAVYAVVKGNGYGLGLSLLSELLWECGVRQFAVTEPEDALRLREWYGESTVLLLRPVIDPATAERLLKTKTIFTVSSCEDFRTLQEACRKTGTGACAHVKVDTGLGRYGFLPENTEEILSLYAQQQDVRFTGIYTHFSAPAADCAYTEKQFMQFMQVIDTIECAGFSPGQRHCCSSSAFLQYPEMRLDAVRIGSAFLGRTAQAERYGLQRTGYCQAVIEEIRTLPAGSRIGYCGLFRTQRPVRIAVCGVGSGNGLGLQQTTGLENRRPLGSWLRRRESPVYGWYGGVRMPAVGRLGLETVLLDARGADCRRGDAVRFDVNPLYKQGMPVEIK